MTLVADYSAVVAICVTTLRKALSILMSFALFPKLWGWGHPVGVILVLGSVFVAKKAKKPGKKGKGGGRGRGRGGGRGREHGRRVVVLAAQDERCIRGHRPRCLRTYSRVLALPSHKGRSLTPYVVRGS